MAQARAITESVRYRVATNAGMTALFTIAWKSTLCLIIGAIAWGQIARKGECDGLLHLLLPFCSVFQLNCCTNHPINLTFHATDLLDLAAAWETSVWFGFFSS